MKKHEIFNERRCWLREDAGNASFASKSFDFIH